MGKVQKKWKEKKVGKLKVNMRKLESSVRSRRKHPLTDII